MKVAVDIVIFTIQEGALKVLLVKRRIPPFRDQLSIPGGFVLPEEDLDEAALRELGEEAGVTDVYLEELYSFGDPKRTRIAGAARLSADAVGLWELNQFLPATVRIIKR